jgi:hypothetical protein
MTYENPEKQEGVKDPRALVESVQTFSELFAALERIGTVSGSQGAGYRSTDLISMIEAVRETNGVPIAITRTHGIREKVQELLDKERGIKKIN